jgi:ferredoxin
MMMSQVRLEKLASGADAPDAMLPARPSLRVILCEGGERRVLEAQEGEALMPVLKRAGVPLLAVCGGKGACGTCRAIFPPEWAVKLQEPSRRELRLLTHLKAGEGERLSCQIQLSSALDGLEVRPSE